MGIQAPQTGPKWMEIDQNRSISNIFGQLDAVKSIIMNDFLSENIKW